MNIRAVPIGLATVALIAACATQPKNVVQLEQAREAVAALTSDPLAAQSASRELQAARQTLARAESALQQKKPVEEVEHLAYMAERQAEIGQVRLAEIRARQQIARAEAERTRVLLEVRERQAQLATERAEKRGREVEEARARLAELQAQQTERGMVLTLGDVLFDTGQASLRPGAALTLNRLAKFLHENPQTRIVIEGHTDARGSDAYNEELSRRRAAAVSDALEIRGVPRDRFQIDGRGEAFPVASNDTPAGRQRNRRVEIVFSDASGRFAEGAVRR